VDTTNDALGEVVGKLYGLTRTRQRFRCLKVGNRFSRSLTTLAVNDAPRDA
jgi:hypothetical protein